MQEKERCNDKQDCSKGIDLEHPACAQAIMHPTIHRGYVNDRDVAERRKRCVFRRRGTASDRKQDTCRKRSVNSAAKSSTRPHLEEKLPANLNIPRSN
jgi:hypothetical protein